MNLWVPGCQGLSSLPMCSQVTLSLILWLSFSHLSNRNQLQCLHYHYERWKVQQGPYKACFRLRAFYVSDFSQSLSQGQGHTYVSYVYHFRPRSDVSKPLHCGMMGKLAGHVVKLPAFDSLLVWQGKLLNLSDLISYSGRDMGLMVVSLSHY